MIAFSRTSIVAAISAIAGSAHMGVVLAFPPVVDPASLNGSDGFVINGVAAQDYAGISVSSAGDINGDGTDDVLIGAWAADPGGVSRAGTSYLVFGGAGIGASGSLELSALDGTDGFAIHGIGVDDYSGISMAGAGDVNGDGFDDLLLGASGADPGARSAAGAVYIVFGGPGVGASGSLELADLDGTNGFTIHGIDAGDNAGRSVAGAGDVNDDGVADILIGAYLADPGGDSAAGEAYVVLGGIGVGASGFFELADLDGTNGFVVNGTDANDNFGWSVAGVGDLNNDGIDDIAIGANGGDPNGSASGEAYIVFGSATVGASGSIDATALTGTSGFVINGIDPGDNTGRVVASAGDVNGDGVSDLLIGSFWADPNGQADAGECAIVFGATGIGASGSMELSSLTGANGYILRGVAAGDWSGFAASGLGDVNDDGADDILIGARSADPNGLTSAGESYVVLGGPGVGAGGTIELAGLSGGDGFTVEGVTANDWSGFAVGAAGDLNSDGVADIMIGARNGDPNGLDSGEIYIVFGQSPAPACAGDVNGDGDTNAADFTILAGNFGSAVPPGTGGDLNGDGIVNAADFTILAGDLGCG